MVTASRTWRWFLAGRGGGGGVDWRRREGMAVQCRWRPAREKKKTNRYDLWVAMVGNISENTGVKSEIKMTYHKKP